MVLQRQGVLPKLPKDLVTPTIVAGVNALGRGQDQESLVRFITTISQTMGPQATQQYIDPNEYIRRLAAAQGIDYLNLVKTPEQMQQDKQQQQEQAMQQSLMDQAGQLASAPALDPSNNPELNEQQTSPTAEGGEEAPAPSQQAWTTGREEGWAYEYC